MPCEGRHLVAGLLVPGIFKASEGDYPAKFFVRHRGFEKRAYYRPGLTVAVIERQALRHPASYLRVVMGEQLDHPLNGSGVGEAAEGSGGGHPHDRVGCR